MRAFFSLATLLTLSLPLPRAKADCACAFEHVKNIGHRGAGTSSAENPLPENTLEGIAEAFRVGADGVEIDVQLSADGELVLMHDDTVDRTTDGAGCVNELTLEELKTLDAGSPSRLGAGIEIPTLGEVFDTFTSGVVNIELKVSTAPEDGAGCAGTDRVELVTTLLAELEGIPRARVIITSFDAEILRMIRAEDDELFLGLLGIGGTASLDAAEEAGFDAVTLFYFFATSAIIEDAHARGLALFVWTLNDEPTMDTLLDGGVDGIITDRPALFAGVKARRCAELPCVDVVRTGCSSIPGSASPLSLLASALMGLALIARVRRDGAR